MVRREDYFLGNNYLRETMGHYGFDAAICQKSAVLSLNYSPILAPAEIWAYAHAVRRKRPRLGHLNSFPRACRKAFARR